MRGRPPVSDPYRITRGGNGRVITLTVSIEMREIIEHEAARTGRPMSGVAERLMEKGVLMEALEVQAMNAARIMRALDGAAEGDRTLDLSLTKEAPHYG